MLRSILSLLLGLGLLISPRGAGALEKGKPMPLYPISQDLSAYVGQTLSVYGILSEKPAQHPIDAGIVRDRRVVYLQVDDGDQIVAYVPKSFAGCQAPLAVKLTGQVLSVPGGSKRPQERDLDPGFKEYQLKVTEGTCLAANSPASWLRDLGLSTVSLPHKQDALDRLSSQGEQALPWLIGHVYDQRLYGTRQEVPAAAINAPHHAPAPKLMTVRIPVGQVCQDLIYTMLAPEYISPYAGNFKPFSHSLFWIRDWSGWWQAHQDQSLAEIRKALEPRVDDFWRQHGTVQQLD